MADIIQIRRDTAANWTSENPVLAEGEFAVEVDTSYFKIGDGVTAWTGLGYVATGPQGNDGSDGTDGAAATIAVGTVATGAEGSPVTINNSGTSSAAVFDFSIPVGATGSTGPQGPAGTPGNLWSLNGVTAEYLSGGATVGGTLTATGGDSDDWNTAFGWGDHALAGYLTAEADTLSTVVSRGSSTASSITVNGLTSNNTVSGLWSFNGTHNSSTKFMSVTQAQYDAIGTKDGNTIYFVE